MSIFLIQLEIHNRRGGNIFIFNRTRLNIDISIGLLLVNKYEQALLLCEQIGGE